MLGDDPERDLLPAQALGMGVFHLHPTPIDDVPGGSFDEALAWISEDRSLSQRENRKSPEAILARARGHLGALQTMMSGMHEDLCSANPIEGEWSIGEIMCHLRDVECEVHLERLERILEQDDPQIVGEDTDIWAEIRQYSCQPGMEAYNTFVANRLELIERLAALAPQDWQRPARHTLLGPIRLHEVMAIANDHDTIHLAQLRKTLTALEA
jgi:hypothetical protein